MIDDDRYRLLHGPYVAPAWRKGEPLECEYRDEDVRVGGLTDALIPWPRMLKSGRPALIVCGDLTRAVRAESVIAIAHHWGVGVVTVWKWRVALGVDPINEGTARLYREYRPEKITATAYAKMTATARTPEAREAQAAIKRGKPIHPNTLAAFLRFARAPRSPKHRRSIRRALREHWSDPRRRRSLGEKIRQSLAGRERRTVNPAHRLWTIAEDRMLGKTLDCATAVLLGRTRESVQARRRALGIPRSRHSYLRKRTQEHDS